MKLIIHAGMPKNGSSSIQAALQASREQLMEKSVLLFDTVNSLSMPRALTDSSSYLPPMKALALRHGGQVHMDHLVSENWEAYEELKQKEADFLIVSSEIFPQLHNRADFWDRLTDGFQSVDFLVYLRSPVKHYASLINQMIQGGNSLHTTFEKHFKMNALNAVFNVKDLCHSRNFSIRLRSFERKDLSEGDVVKDFSIQLSSLCGRNINLKNIPPQNESFSHEALFALYVFNNVKGFDTTSIDWNVRKSLSDQLRKLDSDNAGKTKKLNFSNPLIEQWLIEDYEEKLEILKQDFGISFQLPEVAHDQQGEHVDIEKLLWEDFYSVTESQLFAKYLSVVMELINQERGS